MRSCYQKGVCKLGCKCAFKHILNRLKANQGSDRNLWQSPKHWISTKHQKEVTSLDFRAKGDILHGMSAIPVRSALQNIGGEVARKFRQSRVAKRSVQQREKKCHTLRIIQQCGENGRRPNALSSEQLGCCAAFIDASMKSFGTAFSTHKGTQVLACEKFFTPPNRTTQEKVVVSRSNVHHEDRELIVESGANLT